MIKNVNLLQNQEYDRYTEEFLIQALANLGQRVGIKGDGIAYHYFTFNDLIKNNNLSASKYVGYLQYVLGEDSSQNYCKFGVKEIDENTGEFISDQKIDITKNINNILYFPNDMALTIPIGGIEKYSKNSICINDGEELTFMIAGKILGAIDNEDFNTILYYYKFDISSNKLKYGAKLSHYYSDNSGDYISLITVANSSYKEKRTDKKSYSGNELSDLYEMNINILNLNNIKSLDINGESLYNSFKNIFNFYSYNTTNHIPFSLIKPEFLDVNELYVYQSDPLINYDNNSPISVITNLFNTISTTDYTIKLRYNSDKNELFAVQSDGTYDYEDFFNYYLHEYNLNLTEELHLINEDISELYFNIFSYYNNQYFLSSKEVFIKTILSKIYEKLLSSNKLNANNLSSTLYIPLNYRFNYTCNNNDTMHIYYSVNNYINCINLSNIGDKSEFWEANDNLVYDYNYDVNKVVIYNFEVNYNDKDSNLINSIDILSIFTMPYINANNNWNINESDTDIQAIGQNAGNPNIIIIYNYDIYEKNESYKVLNAVSNSDKINQSIFKKTEFKVHSSFFNNIINDDTTCYAYIPEINEKNIKYFENSIILSISDLNCFENNLIKSAYNGTYVFTIWHLVEDTSTNNIYFDFIKQPNLSNDNLSIDYALVLGTGTNLINATSDTSVANLNDQDLILLKAVITELGQENLLLNSNNWMIIKNKQSEEYKSNITNYNNDLNGVIQYNDNVTLDSNHIIYKQNKKYITSLNNIDVTNSVYPKYETNYKDITISDSKTIQTSINELINERVSKIIVKSNNTFNEIETTDEYLTFIQNQLKETSIDVDKKIKIETVSSTGLNYEEYIFNKNVPTLDFGEVFNRNFNVLNRVNIVSLDEYGRTYNAYIGTTFNDKNKNILHIGSTNTNINIGNDTLLDLSQINKFNVHDTLSLDFDYINLNSKYSLITNNNNIIQKTFNNIVYTFVSLDIIEYIFTYNESADVIISSYNISTAPEVAPYRLNLTNLFKKYFNDDSLIDDSDSGVIIYSNKFIEQINRNSEKMIKSLAYEKDGSNIYIYFNPDLIDSSTRKLDIVNNDLLWLPFKLNIVHYETTDAVTGKTQKNLHISIK